MKPTVHRGTLATTETVDIFEETREGSVTSGDIFPGRQRSGVWGWRGLDEAYTLQYCLDCPGNQARID